MNRERAVREGIVVSPHASTRLDVLHGELDLGEKWRCSLLTDGFDRLVNTFKVYTYRELMNALETKGLEVLGRELRELELEDPECMEYPRLKVHDDASLIYVKKTSSSFALFEEEVR